MSAPWFDYVSTPDAEYAAALILAVEPSDRALRGWGGGKGHPAWWAAWYLHSEADLQQRRDRLRALMMTPRRSTTR